MNPFPPGSYALGMCGQEDSSFRYQNRWLPIYIKSHKQGIYQCRLACFDPDAKSSHSWWMRNHIHEVPAFYTRGIDGIKVGDQVLVCVDPDPEIDGGAEGVWMTSIVYDVPQPGPLSKKRWTVRFHAWNEESWGLVWCQVQVGHQKIMKL